MSGETEQHVSAWTADTLAVYFQRQLDDLRVLLDERYATQTKALDAAFAAADKAVAAALLSAKEAVTKAETATEKRFDSVNEFRAALSDQSALFLPRTEYAANHQNLADRVSDLTDRINRSEGSTEGVRVSAGVLASVATIAVLVIGLIVAFANYATG